MCIRDRNGIIRIHLPDYICRLLFQFGKHIHGFCHKIHIFFTWLNSGTGKQDVYKRQALYSALKEVIETTGRTHLRQTIAVFGSHSGCGATHIAIALVTTLNYLGISAVYQEKNWSNDLRKKMCIRDSISTIISRRERISLLEFPWAVDNPPSCPVFNA